MLKIVNPATEELIQEVAEDTNESISQKFAAAKKAQPAWAQTPFEKKAASIRGFRELIVQRKEELAKILTSEVGKPVSQSKNELNGLLGRIDYFLNQAQSVMNPQTVHTEANLEEKISYEPLGVIANISAWNYPYFVGSNVFVPALLTGNAVLYKPSEFATLTGLAIAEMLHQAGVPKDVFIPVIGAGPVGSAILNQPIDGVFFTGSYATGARIAEAAGRKMIKMQLELGGKDSAYVCEDVDVKTAAESLADGAFYNNGQSCCSVERIYVHHKVYSAFVDAFMATVKQFQVGNPQDEKTYIGPLTRKAQLDILEKQIADAKAKGAKMLTGGNRIKGKGYYFEPTVFVDTNHSMELMREESFGPLIGIQSVQSDDEAIRLINDTTYGLTSGVYTRDAERARKILSQANSGSVYWNCCDRVSPRLPWSGRGHSGIGSTLSTLGIQTFLQPKAWHLRQS